VIESLATPSVVVVDDEEEDYRAIISALNSLYIGCVHFTGDSIEELPGEPFKSLRLVFMDLHLGGAVGKDAASRAANVFRKLVSPDTAAVVVVIWSKYADDTIGDGQLPQEDGETEADLFQRTLLEAEPRYAGRLIFLKMAKPKPGSRPKTDEWTADLASEISKTLAGRPAVALLWTWETMLREAGTQVSEGLTALAAPLHSNTEQRRMSLEEGLEAVLQMLSQAQSEGGLSEATAPFDVVTLLDQLLADQVQHGRTDSGLADHGKWLVAKVNAAALNPDLASKINGFLLTAPLSRSTTSFLPGTVYECTDVESFERAFGVNVGSLLHTCCQPSIDDGIPDDERRKKAKEVRDEWKQVVKPVLLELSPDCDVAQNKRHMALVVAGLVLPVAESRHVAPGDAFQKLPKFRLRWPGTKFPEQDVVLMFCSRYKLTLPAGTVPEWVKPWFRLREMPTAALRNWLSGYSARIGYVSLP
jgi:hypothetical protein